LVAFLEPSFWNWVLIGHLVDRRYRLGALLMHEVEALPHHLIVCHNILIGVKSGSVAQQGFTGSYAQCGIDVIIMHHGSHHEPLTPVFLLRTCNEA